MKPKRTGADQREIAQLVDTAVGKAGVYDIHTHLYDPAFGELLLWGIDELLVYHYLVAEVFRYSDIPYETFWRLTKSQQADHIWEHLFLQHSPVSEACRGVITTLNLLGLDPRKKDLVALRKWFARWRPVDYISKCLELTNVRKVCMTNSPFDAVERPLWLNGFTRDGRFDAALRIDLLLLSWPETTSTLKGWGYSVTNTLNPRTIKETRRFLEDWTRRIQARYLMVSLPPEFCYPDQSATSQLLDKVVLPHCRDQGLPFAVMMGVKRCLNPQLRLAGDGAGQCDLSALTNLCADNPGNKFLATILARENQHEACVIARKFRNLHLFGCWWFTNIPVVIEEMTRMRLELLGTSVTLQHSDARVLDQLLYKWHHSRRIISNVLTSKYLDLCNSGWTPSRTEIERDVGELLGGSFERFCKA